MEKIKISRDLLIGVELCSKQLDIIKSQLNTFLSDNETRKEGKSNKRSKVTISDSEISFSTESISTESNDVKDKNYVGPDSNQTRSKYSKRFTTDLEDKAYKPNEYYQKQVKPVKDGSRGRGRPPKNINSDILSIDNKTINENEKTNSGTLRHRGRPKKLVADDLVTQSSNEEDVSTKSNILNEIKMSEKRGRGRPPSSKIVNNIIDENIASTVSSSGDINDLDKDADSTMINKRGRGRPSKTMGKVNISDERLPAASKKRGRPRLELKSMNNGEDDSSAIENGVEGLVSSTPRKRGRPSKFITNQSVTMIK